MTDIEMEKLVVDMRQSITRMEEQIKGAFHRIDEQKKLAESVHQLAVSVSAQTLELKQMRRDMDIFRKDVDELKAKPAKRWEAAVGQIVSLIIAAAFGAVIMKIGG